MSNGSVSEGSGRGVGPSGGKVPMGSGETSPDSTGDGVPAGGVPVCEAPLAGAVAEVAGVGGADEAGVGV